MVALLFSLHLVMGTPKCRLLQLAFWWAWLLVLTSHLTGMRVKVR